MILLYLLCIIIVLWLGQWINQRLLKRNKVAVAYVCFGVVLFIQGILIYHFVKAILQWLTFILKLFYK
ncbi:hypothetical protein [Staphylococcus ratti]|uniref:Uncharacterized protein n=1 Tax=Staphylococcus ratti TaxID=2892440 RepID=A0ABY3PBT5_9STAP|nr:hypothetical protein [Staphylococcus ratti]UEX89777.1 hypothetical protein LN051_09435 [Staphylococcus ratti]